MNSLSSDPLKLIFNSLGYPHLLNLKNVSQFFKLKVSDYLKTDFPKRAPLKSSKLSKVSKLSPQYDSSSLVTGVLNQETLKKQIANICEIARSSSTINSKISASPTALTPLEYWATHDNLMFVETLVDAGARDRVRIGNRTKTSALYQAAISGHIEVVKYLLEQGARADVEFDDHIELSFGVHGNIESENRDVKESFLLKFTQNLENLSIIRFTRKENEILLKKRLDCLEIILTYLYIRNRQALRELLNQVTGDWGGSLAKKAFDANLPELFFLIENFGAKIPNFEKEKQDLFFSACESKSLAFVTFFVEKCKVDVNSKTGGGLTPLHLAASAKKDDVVDYLLQRKADPNLTNNEGEHYETFAKRILPYMASKVLHEDIAYSWGYGGFSSFEGCLSYFDEKVIDLNKPLDDELRKIRPYSVNTYVDSKTEKKILLHFMFAHVDSEKRRNEIPMLIAKGARLDVADKKGITPLQQGINKRKDFEKFYTGKDKEDILAKMDSFLKSFI